MTVIPSGHVLIGTDKGGLVHGSERPRYEASIPEFMIMYSFLTVKQFNKIVDEKGGEKLRDNGGGTRLQDDRR